MHRKPRVMPKRKPLTDSEGEVRELTARDLKTARRFSGLPATERARMRRNSPDA
jgi:hypothetical protein